MIRDGTDYEMDINKMSTAREAILQLASTGKQTAFVQEDVTASTEAIEEERIPENNRNSGWMILGAAGGLALLGGAAMWIRKKKGK